MSDVTKKESSDLSSENLSLGVVNAGIPSDFYSHSPCLVGYTYIRFEVSGDIAPCCIAKHTVGSAYDQDWRDVWHSGAQENFRRKMSRIHIEKFHLKDPEWTFCQQCSHMEINKDKNALLKKDRK